MLDVRAQGVFERVGAVAGAVVGQDPFDGDAAGFEIGVGAFPEPGRGLLLLIGQDLGVGEPGVVIDGVVQERVARSPVRRGAGLVPVAGGPAEAAVAAAVRDPSEFLDVDVDQVPGAVRARSGGSPGPWHGPATTAWPARTGTAPGAPWRGGCPADSRSGPAPTGG